MRKIYSSLEELLKEKGDTIKENAQRHANNEGSRIFNGIVDENTEAFLPRTIHLKQLPIKKEKKEITNWLNLGIKIAYNEIMENATWIKSLPKPDEGSKDEGLEEEKLKYELIASYLANLSASNSGETIQAINDSVNDPEKAAGLIGYYNTLNGKNIESIKTFLEENEADINPLFEKYINDLNTAREPSVAYLAGIVLLAALSIGICICVAVASFGIATPLVAAGIILGVSTAVKVLSISGATIAGLALFASTKAIADKEAILRLNLAATGCS